MAEDLKNKKLLQITIDEILENEGKIALVTGKDLIIFIGPDLSGKSTIINSLIGIRLEKKKDYIIPIRPDSFIKPIEIIFDVGNKDQKYHVLNLFKKDNICYLKAPIKLFCESMGITIKLLFHEAINLSKSARIVFLIQYFDYEAGWSNLYQILNQFCVVNCNLPIFILFNQFIIPNDFTDDSFVLWDEKRKNRAIKKEIIHIWKKIYIEAKINIRHEIRKIANKAKKNGLISVYNILKDENDLRKLLNNEQIRELMEHDPGFKQVEKQYKYMMLIKNNFEKGYFGYIDPTSPESVQRFINDISKLPELDPKYLIFNGDNSDRTKFDRMFFAKIIKDIDFMKKLKFSIQYGEDIINPILEKTNENLKIKNELLLHIEKYPLKKDILDALIEEENRKKNNLFKSIKNLKEKQRIFEQILDMYMKYGDYEIWDENFHELIGFLNYTKLIKKVNFNQKAEKIALNAALEDDDKLHTYIQYAPEINLNADSIYNLAAMKENFNLLAYPKKLNDEIIQAITNNIDEIRNQIIFLNAKLIVFNRNTQKSINEKLSNFIFIIKQDLEQLKEIKCCIKEIIDLISDNTKFDPISNEIIKNNHIIEKIYKNYSNDPVLSEFVELYNYLDSKQIVSQITDDDTLIANGSIIFHLKQY